MAWPNQWLIVFLHCFQVKHMNAHGLEGFNQDLRKCEGKLIFTHPLWAIWRDRISRGFIFAISIGNYEKTTLNVKTQAFSINYILFFRKSELI